jgi:hypothetical protein
MLLLCDHRAGVPLYEIKENPQAWVDTHRMTPAMIFLEALLTNVPYCFVIM